MGNYREATNGDIRELKKVAFAAWSHAYRGIYEPSTIRRKVSAHYSTTALEAAIEKAKAGETFFFVTSDEGGIVGYANGGRISSPWMDPSKTGGKSYDISAWELTRIYLLPEYVGRGIGKALLSRWERFLKQRRVDRYYVSYNRRNTLARDFYARNGFVRAKEFDDGPVHCAVKEI